MYTSILTTLLLTSTTLAATLPPSLGHGPVVPSEYDSEVASPIAKRQGLPLGDTLGLGSLLGTEPEAETEPETETEPKTETTPAPRISPASEVVMTTTMVTVTATLSTSLAVAPSGSASPVPEDLAGVYVCDDVNWNGACSHHFTRPGGSDIDCAQLSGRESSIGPDPGFLCEFFTNSYCRKTASDESDFVSLSWPGSPDLTRTDKGDFNDKFLSYVCFKVL